MSVSGRRRKLTALAVVATVALSGCAGLNPGAAAVVESKTISRETVADATRAMCSFAAVATQAQGQGGGQTVLNRDATRAAFNVLLRYEIAKRFAEKEGIEVAKREISEGIEENENGILMFPEERQEDSRDLIAKDIFTNSVILQAGSRGQEGGGQADQQAAYQAGDAMLAEFAAGLDIEVDPRYGSFEEGQYTPSGSSLSVPVSEAATKSSADQSDPAYADSLPASQQCS